MANLKIGHFIAKEGLQMNFESQEDRVCLPRAIPKSFFSKQRKIRRYKRIGLNQREIAKLLDISPMIVNRVVRNQLKKPKFKAPGFVSSNIAYYFGLIAGDGSVGEQFSFTSADQELIDFFKTYTLKTFGVEVTQSEKNGTKAVLLRPKESNHFTYWLHKIFGNVNADTKDVPKCIRQSSFNHQLRFLQGLFDTDGYSRVNNKDAEIALNSKELIDFVCVMLSTMGIGYKRSFRGKSHRVYIRQSKNLYKLFKLGRKQQPKSNKEPLIRDYRRISNIEVSESDVYDLTNPESHSFVANGFVVHNSTILRYISGLQTPTSGKILIHGRERTQEDRVGMVFQQYSSFPWMSVLDNVALGLEYQGIPLKQRREKAMEMIKLVGLEGHENKYAQYPTLSGGQLQRVAIARSIVYHSEILLMDEPFGALDIETRLQMQDLLAKIWVDINPTVVFVTHDIPEAVYLGDDIYVMGRNPGNIRKMFRSPLPFVRNKSMKRSPPFIEAVNEIEDYMLSVEAKS
jgi:NitT/TauT family transport system ATP-binding protein